MGKGRDKRRKQKGSTTAGQGASKTQRKTVKNELKQERRLDRRLQEDEEDIDALLEKFRLEDIRNTQPIIEDDCDPPSVRVHASYTPIPHDVYKDGSVMVFGGEYEDPKTRSVKTFNDLYRFSTEKRKWTKIVSPNSPPPRSSHQTVFYKKALYLFGGEFTSPKQDRFKHFRDLWRFDLETNTWEKYDIKKAPSGRSGHRSGVYKNKMVVFGGFNDSGDAPIYYNDLWVFDFEALKWEEVGIPSGQAPSPRGGCRLTIYGNVLYIYGGYSRYKDDEEEDMEHGKVMDDMWKLDLERFKWEKVKKSGIVPGTRSGFNMAIHNHRAILFGGATDNEAKKGETIVSEFHNDLFQFHFEKEKWYTVQLRPPRIHKADILPDAANITLLAEEEEKMRQHNAAVKIQSRYRGYVVRKAFKVYKLGGKVSELMYSPATYGFDPSVLNAPKPRGRISAGLCIVRNDLWLFGGVVEILEREITLDDIWKLNLKNYDGWHCIKENTVGDDAFKEDAESSEPSETEEDSD